MFMRNAIALVLYLAAMGALTWGAWQIVPTFTDWAMETFGLWPVFGALVAFIAGSWALSYYLGRKPSGTALDP